MHSICFLGVVQPMAKIPLYQGRCLYDILAGIWTSANGIFQSGERASRNAIAELASLY